MKGLAWICNLMAAFMIGYCSVQALNVLLLGHPATFLLWAVLAAVNVWTYVQTSDWLDQ